MVEQHKNNIKLDLVFKSLSDPTRRDIIRLISKKDMSVGQIALHYQLTFAGVAKHLEVMHHAELITKTKRGKEQIVSLSPQTLAAANYYLENFKGLWQQRLNSLDQYLKSTKPTKGKTASRGKGKK